jgi:hypothetical protein
MSAAPEPFVFRQHGRKVDAWAERVEYDARMLLSKLWRVWGEEARRMIGAVKAMLEHMRAMDEQALRSLGVVPRGPRSE